MMCNIPGLEKYLNRYKTIEKNYFIEDSINVRVQKLLNSQKKYKINLILWLKNFEI